MPVLFLTYLYVPTFVFAKFLTRKTRRLTFILCRSFCHKTITCPFFSSTIIHKNCSISIYILISWNWIGENLVRNFVVMSTNKKAFKIYLFLISPYKSCITLENKYLFGMIGVDWIYYQYHCWRTVISWYVLLLRGRNQISNRMPSICENTTILYYPRCNRMHNSVTSYKKKIRVSIQFLRIS